MTTGNDATDRLSWTTLAIRMGFTSRQPQRDEILDAIGCMNWVHTRARHLRVDNPAVGAVVMAIVHHGRTQAQLIGNARLNGGRQLIGLEDGHGIRRYVLDLGSEAIYVLAEVNPSSTSAYVTQLDTLSA